MKKGINLILYLLLTITVHSQDSCLEFPVRFVDIIQNPSFEINPATCTSGYFGEQGLIIPGWTTPTNEILTGYLNACTNFLIPDNTIINESYNNVYMYMFPLVPQPIPDGNGVAAVADFGYEGNRHVYAFQKSYVSTCLTQPLEKDSLYRLDFYAGFGNKGSEVISVNVDILPPEGSLSQEKFTLFGLVNCTTASLPLIGCLTVAGWTPLGSVLVKSSPGSWVKTNIKFKSPDNIQAIALGPSCDTTIDLKPGVFIYNGDTLTANKYSYFLDALQLKKSKVPAPVVKIISGSSCSQNINLQIQPVIFASGYHIQWYKNGALLANENNPELSVSRQNYGTGFYQCSVQNDSTCIGSDSLYVDLAPIPNTSVLGLPDTVACLGDTVVLNPVKDTSFNYTWQDGSTNPSFSTTQNGMYSVTISNACGSIQAQKTVTFQKCLLDVFVPNAFTPNGDGRNDFFRLTYMEPPLTFRINIYNRNGQRVFVSADPSRAWDGSFNGKQQPSGSYVYDLEFTDRKHVHHLVKGVIELIR